MKIFTTIVCLWLLGLIGLIGCKTKQVTTTTTTVRETQTDTSTIKVDSVLKSTTKQEKRTTVTLYNDWGYIEFADSGGTLTIDGGLIKANGVKSYHQGKQAAQKQDTDLNEQADSTATHKEQANGITNERQSDTKQQPKAQQKQSVATLKWYQRTIYHIGALCCIAAIIWAVFLYIKKRK